MGIPRPSDAAAEVTAERRFQRRPGAMGVMTLVDTETAAAPDVRLFLQLPVACVLTDRKGAIALWNAGAEDLLGWPARAVLGRRIHALAPAGAERGPLADLIVDVASGSPREARLRVSSRAGATLTVDVRAAPFVSAADGVVGVILVVLTADEAADARAGEAVGRRIAAARRAAGLTQKQLAAMIGVTRRSVQSYEAGAVVPYKHADRLGEALGLGAGWIMDGEAPADALQESLREVVRNELRAVLTETGVLDRDAA
jgi:PAS domain S-box-containing protein